MSRLFKIKSENGEILDIGIQQYEVGLYVCVSPFSLLILNNLDISHSFLFTSNIY